MCLVGRSLSWEIDMHMSVTVLFCGWLAVRGRAVMMSWADETK